MENKTLGVLIGVIILLIIIYLYLKKTGQISRQSNTGSDTNVGTTVSTTSTSTSTGTGTGTPLPPSNQITLTKVTPVYYQFKPTQPGFPPAYPATPVTGITLPQGKVVTIVQVWTSQSGQGKFYETTEPVNASLLNQVNPHLFIKETDL